MISAESSLNSLKISQSKDKANYSESKMFDSNNDGQFSKILESANKSYNFTYEKVSETPFSFNSSTNSTAETFTKDESSFYKSYLSAQNGTSSTFTEVKQVNSENVHGIKDYGTQVVPSQDNPVKYEKTAAKEEPKPVSKDEKTYSRKTEENVVENKQEKKDEKIKSKDKAEHKAEQKAVDTQQSDKQAIIMAMPIHSKQVEKVVQVSGNTAEQVASVQMQKDFGQKQEITAGKKTDKNEESKKTTSPISALKQNEQKAAELLAPKESNSDKAIKDSINVQINTDLLKDNKVASTKGENNNIDRNAKIKDGITNDLKPVVTKIEIAKPDIKDSSSNKQENPSLNLKFGASSLTNIESQITKINLDKSADFGKVISKTIAQQPQNNIDEANVLDQVSKNTAEQLKLNKSQISMILRPESLGKVNLNISSERGVMSAEITAETNAAKEILSKGLDALKQSLQDQGINVNTIVVKVQEPAPSENKQFGFEQNMQHKFGETDNNASNSNSSRNGTASNATNQANTEIETNIPAESSKEAVSHNGTVDYTV